MELARIASSQEQVTVRLLYEAGYLEKGYISQPIPTATSKNATNAQAMYFARSDSSRFERNANVTDTTRAKNVKA